MICETCGYWAAEFESVIDGHHPNCPELVKKTEPDARVLSPEEEAEIEAEVDYVLNKFGVR